MTTSQPTDCCDSNDGDDEVLFDDGDVPSTPSVSQGTPMATDVDDKHETADATLEADARGPSGASDKHGSANGISWAVDDCALAMQLINHHGKHWKRIAEEFNRGCSGPARNHQQIRCWWWRHMQGEKTGDGAGKSRNKCRRCGEPKRGHICKNSMGVAMKRSTKRNASSLAHGGERATSEPRTPPMNGSACTSAPLERLVGQPSIFDLAAPTKEDAPSIAVAHSMPTTTDSMESMGSTESMESTRPSTVAASLSQPPHPAVAVPIASHIAHVPATSVPLDARICTPRCIDLKHIPLGSLAAAVPLQSAAQTLLFNCFVK